VERIKGARDALELTGQIIPFGSHVNGLRTAASDCDLSYSPEEGSAAEKPILVLQRFANELPKHGFTGIITVFQASVPLVKAIDESGVEVDLCFGNQLGIRNSKLVAAYCGLDSRVAEVGRLVKQWAKSMELVGSSDGHLNSYAYTLLTLFYLMKRRPPVIPNLQDLGKHQDLCESVIIRDRRWGREIPWDCRFWEDISLIPQSLNNESVDTLLTGFFEYYSNGAFDWGQHAVTVRLAMTQAGPFSKMNLYSSVQPDQWYIEDPFDQRHNLASQCSSEGRQRIMGCMKSALQALTEAKDPRTSFEEHCRTGDPSCMMKCRVHVEKVSLEQFTKVFDTCGVGPFKVHFPSGPVRGGDEVREAFLEFQGENDRRRVHRLNETYVGEWQLRFLPCSKWAFIDANEKVKEKFEEKKVAPGPGEPVAESEKTVEDSCEEVRHGLRVAQTRGEMDVLILRAQALGIDWEEHTRGKKLQGANTEPPAGGGGNPGSAAEPFSEAAPAFQ